MPNPGLKEGHPKASTFDVGNVDVELGELFTGLVHALVNRLEDLLGVLLHPSAHKHTTSSHNQPHTKIMSNLVPVDGRFATVGLF